MAKKETIELKKIEVKHAIVSIEGEGDLVLNKMNARTERELTEQRENNKTVRKPANMWEDIITAIHWRDGDPASRGHGADDHDAGNRGAGDPLYPGQTCGGAGLSELVWRGASPVSDDH